MYFLIMTDVYESMDSVFFDKMGNIVQAYNSESRKLDWLLKYPELRCTNLQLEAYLRDDIDAFQRLKKDVEKQVYQYGLLTASTMAANIFRLLMLEETLLSAECVYIFYENGIFLSNTFNAYANFKGVNNGILDTEMNLAAKILRLQAQMRRSTKT